MRTISQGMYRKIFIVGQVATMNIVETPCTAYAMRKALGCSVPTARKYLKELVNEGILIEEKQPYKNTFRMLYTLTEYGYVYFKEYRKDYISILDLTWKQLLDVK